MRATCSLPAVHFDLACVVLDAAQALWAVLPGAGVPCLLQRLEGSGGRRPRADYGSWSRTQGSSEPFDRWINELSAGLEVSELATTARVLEELTRRLDARGEDDQRMR